MYAKISPRKGAHYLHPTLLARRSRRQEMKEHNLQNPKSRIYPKIFTFERFYIMNLWRRWPASKIRKHQDHNASSYSRNRRWEPPNSFGSPHETSVLHCISLSFLVGIAISGPPAKAIHHIHPADRWKVMRRWKKRWPILWRCDWEWLADGSLTVSTLGKNMMIIKHPAYTPIDAENLILVIHLWIPSESMRVQGKVLHPLKIISCTPRSVQGKGHIIYIPRCLLEDLEGKKWKNTTCKTRNLGKRRWRHPNSEKVGIINASCL